MNEKIEHLGHEFYPCFIYKEHKHEMTGTYYCSKCLLSVFIGSESLNYKGTPYDGIVVSYIDNMWIENFLTCNEQIIKNLLE